MKIGTIIEYIDQQKITCAAVMDIKGKRLRILTEFDKEVNLAESRISFVAESIVDTSLGRSNIVDALKAISVKREKLKELIDLKELWELVNEESDWINLPTMAEYCFSEPPEPDQQAAVVRACFGNRLYFKFDHDKFLPYSVEHMENALLMKEKEKEYRIFGHIKILNIPVIRQKKTLIF